MKYTIALLTIVATALTMPNVQGAPSVGSPAPEFTLTDTAGKSHSLADLKGKYVVLEWLDHNCPFVKKHYGSGNMQDLQRTYADKGVVWLSIYSTNAKHKGYRDAAATDAMTAKTKAAPAAVLLDADGKVGKLYGAKTTPNMYVVDPEGTLIYSGAIDNKKSADPADVKTADNYVRMALDEAMAGKPVTTATTRPYGCGVKYAK